MAHHSSGKRSVGYFVNWAIYARKHNPQDLAAEHFTHINYAFANIRPESGEVYLSDTWSDLEKHYPTDSWNDVGTNVYGCVKQLNLLKRKHRNLKVLLCIGGWTYSSNFNQPISTETGRKTFANSSVTLLKDLGFDGLDIDYEYPANAEQARNYVLLLEECRRALDDYAVSVGQPKGQYQLTVATPAGPENYQRLLLSEMDKTLDFWNLMAYDYAGSWEKVTGHLANTYAHEQNPQASPFNTKQALDYYKHHGVPSSKLTLGIPLYGRGFTNTDGMGMPFNGVGAGSWEAGVWDYKVLPPAGADVKENMDIHASWSRDASKREVISFDSMEVMKAKAHFVNSLDLGGLMWWETSADHNGSRSAVANQVAILRQGAGLEQRQNVVHYPKSKYDNVRNGFSDN